jgi:hypothetical protein
MLAAMLGIEELSHQWGDEKAKDGATDSQTTWMVAALRCS